MAESVDERRSMAGKQRAIKTRNVTKDVRVVDKAQDLSGHLKETYIRTKENTKSVLDDSRDDSTNYAVDRSEETAETVAYETKREIRKGNEKVKDQVEKRVRKHMENQEKARRNEASVKRTDPARSDNTHSIKT